MSEYAAAETFPSGTELNHAGQPLSACKFSSPAVPLIIFVVLAAAIAAVGVMIFEQYRQSMQQAVQKDLFGITDAKVKQFLVWREEGRQEANVLMNDDSFRTEFERW
ncbi:MAG: hypothetical protein HY847_09905, partial [Betaproteobacteria bacterium]|nr:hypothetical protein [Betaproteobacteria bacterium]